MAKLALLFPYQEITDIAAGVIKDRDDIICNKTVPSAAVVSEARKAVEDGADIVIARGGQAMLIKRYTNIPLVELRIHSQEIGLLLKKARVMLKIDEPVIGLVAFRNMLSESDMSAMDELFGVRLLIAYMEKTDDAFRCAAELAAKGARLFIGGEAVCEAANTLGFPALVYQTSPESVMEALREADHVAYALETEKKNARQLETVMGGGFNGIIKVNSEGCIIAVNRLIEELVGKKAEELIGLAVFDAIPQLDPVLIMEVLKGDSDGHSTSAELGGSFWTLLIAPLQYQDRITGAILSLQRFSEAQVYRSARNELIKGGLEAKTGFRDIHAESTCMSKCISLAGQYALSGSPVLIYAEDGTEYAALAEAIHNNGSRRHAPFVSIDLGAAAPDDQERLLFGDIPLSGEYAGTGSCSAVGDANEGTLFLRGIEHASLPVQRCLAALPGQRGKGTAVTRLMEGLDIRLIVSTDTGLSVLVNRGEFSRELFYGLQGLTLEVPPLRERKEDLLWYMDRYFAEYCKKYARYLVLTEGARKRAASLDWFGNITQLKAFLERLVITSDKRSVDETRFIKLYESLYPDIRERKGVPEVVRYASPEAYRINELLEKYHGSRQKTAEALHISTSTLWRKMKKYGI